jgi:hypothetical protein
MITVRSGAQMSDDRTYIAIERAVSLGSDYQVEGKVYVLEPDGRLKPIDGKELIELHAEYPNFVKGWKLY